MSFSLWKQHDTPHLWGLEMWRVSKKILSNYMALLMLQPHNLCWPILKLSNPSTTTKRSMAGYGQQKNENASGGTCCDGCEYVDNPNPNREGPHDEQGCGIQSAGACTWEGQ